MNITKCSSTKGQGIVPVVCIVTAAWRRCDVLQWCIAVGLFGRSVFSVGRSFRSVGLFGRSVCSTVTGSVSILGRGRRTALHCIPVKTPYNLIESIEDPHGPTASILKVDVFFT
jgi:hypothetical protein